MERPTRAVPLVARLIRKPAIGPIPLLLATLLWLLLPLPLPVAGAQVHQVKVNAQQFAFSPSVLRVNRGDTVAVTLEASDSVHGLYVDGYGIDLKAEPGHKATATFTADREGRFLLRCSITCGPLHPFMVGELVVEPNPLLPKSLIAAVALALVGLLWAAKPGDTTAVRRTFDLARLPLVTGLLGSRWFPFVLTAATLPLFVFAIVVGLAGTPVGNRNFAVVFVWIVWWAVLMLVLVPLGGRVWCSACPLPTPGEWLQRRALVGVSGRLHTAGWRWPVRLRNMWPQNIGFLAVAVFSVPILTTPALTGWVLLALLAGATFAGLLFEKRTFCRYLCPVGGFIGLYSQVAPLSLRVGDREVCRAHKAKTCCTGSDKGYGCPWMVYPGALERNAHCGLCTECVKTCPLKNVSLRLQAPGADLAVAGAAKADEGYKGLIMLGSALAYAVVLTGPDSGLKETARAVGTLPWLAYAGTFVLLNLAVLPGLFQGAVLLGRRLGRGSAPVRSHFGGWAKALIPLGLAAWAAFSLGLALGNGSYAWAVLSDPFGWGWNLFGTVAWGWTPYATQYVPLLQALLLLGGLLWAVKVAVRQGHNLGMGRLASLPVVAFCAAVTAILLAVYVG